MTQTVTITDLEPAVMRRIEREAERTELTIEEIVRQLILRGVEAERDTEQQPISHDLNGLAGTWTSAEAEEFRRNSEAFNQIDPALWSRSNTTRIFGASAGY